MNANRLWIEIVTLCAGVALALALAIATLGAAVEAFGQAQELPRPAAASAVPQETYVGMVTCSRCGAKHSANLGQTASDCTRICVHSGAGFALVDGEKAYILDGNLEALKKVAGQRARIVGNMKGKTITVSFAAEI